MKVPFKETCSLLLLLAAPGLTPPSLGLADLKAPEGIVDTGGAGWSRRAGHPILWVGSLDNAG